jgi:putative DNA primase/helicase
VVERGVSRSPGVCCLSELRPVDLILSKLQGVKHRRDGIWAQCPAHDDQDPSLKIWEGEDGAACVKCHSIKCSTEEILRAIGLEKKDLFPKREASSVGRGGAVKKKKAKPYLGPIVKYYWYTDELGKQAHATTRHDPKDFRQGYNDPTLGNWVWGLRNIKTYLYGLPRLLQAVAAGKEIYLPEGEKDAEIFWAHDLEATTNPMGATNWKPYYFEWLRGAKICIVRDPDEAGYKRCAFLYKELSAVGCWVRAVQAADIEIGEKGGWACKDAFDHFKRGYGVDEFESIANPLEKFKGSVHEPMNWERRRRERIAEGEEPGPTWEEHKGLGAQENASQALELQVVEGGVPVVRASGAPPPETPIPEGRDPGDRWYPQTEHGNCRRLVDRFGEDIRWCPDFGAWLVWTGSRWRVDRTGGAPLQAMAVKIVRDLEARLKKYHTGSDEWKSLLAFIKQTASKKGIKNMIELASLEPGVPVLADQLDANPYVAGASNGTLDLTTGKLRKSSRDDLITLCLGVPYDEHATCPAFDKFLDEALLSNPELIEYTWRAFGYSLTGSVDGECFFFLHGPGGGGKGTTTRVLGEVMGGYAKTLRAASLQAKNMDAIPQDIAKLKGARVAFVHETAENKRWDENLMKELTGGNEVTARFMRQDEFTFMPQFKLWICGNHKPDIISYDRSWARRFRLLPFERSVPEEKVDEKLKGTLSKEAPGVLAKMVRYCVEWRSKGLPIASVMKKEMEIYKEESDSVGRFLSQCCEIEQYAGSGDEGARGEALYLAYKAWAKRFNEYEGNIIWFGKDLRLKGYEKVRDKHGFRYPGIILVEPQGTLSGEDPKYAH